MFVRDWMNKDIISIQVDDTILDAIHAMKENKVRRLPVLKGDKLVGIITEKDIKSFSPSKASSLDIYEVHSILAKSVVADAMTKDVISVSPDAPVEKAALILRDMRFGGLPVVDGDQLVGVISAVDLFDLFVEAMGMRVPGARISIYLEDRSGAIAEMAKIIKQNELNIVSLATFYLKGEMSGFRDVVIRVAGDKDNINTTVTVLIENNFNVSSVIFMDGTSIIK